MRFRPGTPITVTDEYLAAILAELRDIKALLGQDVAITTVETTEVVEAVREVVEEAVRPGQGVVVE